MATGTWKISICFVVYRVGKAQARRMGFILFIFFFFDWLAQLWRFQLIRVSRTAQEAGKTPLPWVLRSV